MRHVQLRRLHRAHRRRVGQELHGARGAGRRHRGEDHRGDGRRGQAAPAPGGLLERPRPAVRLLHARDDHGRRRPAQAQPRPLRGGRPPRAGGQPLPLHRLPQHREGRPQRREGGRGRDRRHADSARGRRRASERRRLGGKAMSATTETTGGNGHVGRALRRKEDPRLITGRALYVDDINMTGQVWAGWVRSPEADAKIVSIDKSAAEARGDVLAVYTNEDLDMEAGLPMAWVPPGVEVKTPDHWVLAKDEVKHVGDPVALVIGLDRYGVVDALEDVIVEYDPLPVVTDPEAALQDGSPLVHESFGTNKSYEWSLGGGDLEAGFAEADVIVERRVVNHRIAGGAIEPRAVLA